MGIIQQHCMYTLKTPMNAMVSALFRQVNLCYKYLAVQDDNGKCGSRNFLCDAADHITGREKSEIETLKF